MFTVTTFVRVVFGLSFQFLHRIIISYAVSLSLAKNQVYTVFYKYNCWDLQPRSTNCTGL